MTNIQWKIVAALLILELLVFTKGAPSDAVGSYGNQPPAYQAQQKSWIQMIRESIAVLPEEPALPEVPALPDLPAPEAKDPLPAVPDPETLDPATLEALARDKEQGLLLLVNKEHSLTRNDKPADLTPIRYFASDRSPESRFLREEAATQFHQLVEAAAKEDLTLVMTTAYRSYGFQQLLYDNNVEKLGVEEADQISAKPGQSEHQTGLAVDISSPSANYQLTEQFGETSEGIWVREHAHLFGFILRYPSGGKAVTGYNYEPWHLRYVGRTAAAIIHRESLTLEEFLISIEN